MQSRFAAGSLEIHRAPRRNRRPESELPLRPGRVHQYRRWWRPYASGSSRPEFRARNIVVWDRLNSDLESAGYRTGIRKDRIRCIGNDAAGYETELAIFGSVGSLLSNTLTRTCDAVINLPVLKDHGIVGVTMALKNLFGAIHNPNKYHLDGGDPYVADVYMLPPIRQKVRLTICDALAPQYEGGPSYMPQWAWPYRGVLVSRDPVALDSDGLADHRAEARRAGDEAAARMSNASRCISRARPMRGIASARTIRRPSTSWRYEPWPSTAEFL